MEFANVVRSILIAIMAVIWFLGLSNAVKLSQAKRNQMASLWTAIMTLAMCIITLTLIDLLNI